MNYLAIFFIALGAFNIIFGPTLIGKPRDPVTPSAYIFTLVINAVLIFFCLEYLGVF